MSFLNPISFITQLVFELNKYLDLNGDNFADSQTTELYVLGEVTEDSRMLV